MKKYTVYKITNLVNGHIYVGKHETCNLEDGYMGSGKLLKFAISKYGIDSFVKEIMYIFDNEDEMNSKEAEIVTEDFCLRNDTYNICVGGKGGFSFINKNKLNVHGGFSYINFNGLNGNKKAVEKVKELARLGIHPHKGNPEAGLAGRKAMSTPEANAKRIKTMKENKHSVGDKNSQYGTMWISNGSIAKKVPKEYEIPEGWYRGRRLHGQF